MQAVRRFAERAARVEAPVLLTGETGTGKGLVARCIHLGSGRAARPFVVVNCAAVPESLFESEFFGHTRGAFTGATRARKGLWEQADGGTLFLDEIAELPVRLQAKLLGILEDGWIRRVGGEQVRRADVRLVAATNIPLAAALADGRLRLDLLHRLAVLTCRLPPLRERDDDAVTLARHFADAVARRYRLPAPRLDPSALARVRGHPWPGNVRQLAHVIEAALLRRDPAAHHAAVTADHLDAALGDGLHDAPRTPRRGPGSTDPERGRTGRYRFDGPSHEEAALIRRALAAEGGNRTKAAESLGMSRTTLRKKLRELGLAEKSETGRSVAGE